MHQLALSWRMHRCDPNPRCLCIIESLLVYLSFSGEFMNYEHTLTHEYINSCFGSMKVRAKCFAQKCLQFNESS